MYQAAGALAGAGLMIGGAIMGSNAANKRHNRLLGIAETPGINSRAVTGEAIGDAQFNLGGAANLVGQFNDTNQSEIDRILETALPGYQALQKQRMKNTMSMVNGELPPDVAAQVMRRSAGAGVRGGYAGTGFGRNRTSRDLGLTSLDLMGQGDRMATGLITTTPRANPVEVQDWAGLTPQQLVAMRSNERYDRLNRLTTAYGAPTGREVIGTALTDFGGALAGASLGGGIKGKS